MEGQRDKVSQMFGGHKKEVKSENDMKYHRISNKVKSFVACSTN